VKLVSLSFFCVWKILKKALLGLQQSDSHSVGETSRQAKI